jgi:hypothetical protein
MRLKGVPRPISIWLRDLKRICRTSSQIGAGLEGEKVLGPGQNG